MKKTILAMAVILTVGLTSAFANNSGDINHNAIAAFHKDFHAAKNVQWHQGKTFVKATFDLNNKVMYAYYTYRGELKAVIHHLLSTELPAELESSIKNDYSGYWITDLFELTNDDQHLYYVTIENADGKEVLKSDGTQGWKFYKSIK